MDGFREGQNVWVEKPDGSLRPGVYVGDVETTTWFGGAPAAYIAFPDTRSGQQVALPRITPRDEEPPR